MAVSGEWTIPGEMAMVVSFGDVVDFAACQVRPIERDATSLLNHVRFILYRRPMSGREAVALTHRQQKHAT